MYPENRIESQLKTLQQIQPEPALSKRCDALFERYEVEHRQKFARQIPQNRWIVKLFAALQSARLQRTAMAGAGLALIAVCAAVLLQDQGALAQTLNALQNVQSLQMKRITQTDEQITEQETVLWQTPNRLKVEQFGMDEHMEKSYWLNGSTYTVLDYEAQQYRQGAYNPDESAPDGNRWFMNAASPVQMVISNIDLIHQNWNAISVREDNLQSNPIRTYAFDYEDGRSTELTIDIRTDLPLFLHFVYPANSRHGHIETTYQFDWNVTFGEYEFDPVIPDHFSRVDSAPSPEGIPSISYPGGFHVNSVRFDMNPPSDPPVEAATVSGRVMDEAGNPVANAEVGIYRLSRYETAALSDSSGSFQFQLELDSNPNSDRQITVNMRTKEFSQQQYVIYCFADGFKTGVLSVWLDEYSPQAHIDFILVPGFSVSGKVVDEHNNPIADARVQILRLYQDQYLTRISTQTDPNGDFTLPGVGLDQEQYNISVYKAGYISQTRHTTVFSRDEVTQSSHTLQEPIVLVSRDNVSVRHRWIHVVDAHGSPIEGAQIMTNSPNEEIITGAEGSFQLSGSVDLGEPTRITKEILVTKEGFGYHFEEVNLLKEEPLVITLLPGYRMKGKVVDQDGNPVQGGQFKYWFQNPHYNFYPNMAMYSPPSGADGLFEITNIPGEEPIFYEAAVPNEIPYVERFGNYIYRNRIEDPTLYQEEPVLIEVDRVSTVEGHVVYADTGEPVPFFTITFNRDPESSGTPRVVQKGNGQITVYQSTSGYFSTRMVTDPIEGYPDEIRIRMKEGYGTLVPNADVHIFTVPLDEVNAGPLRLEIPRAD